MTGWNLPPGCTDHDIDVAAGYYDNAPDPEEEEDEVKPKDSMKLWEIAESLRMVAADASNGAKVADEIARLRVQLLENVERYDSGRTAIVAVASEIAQKAGWNNLAAAGIPIGLARSAITGVLSEQMDDWAERLRKAVMYDLRA